MEEYHRHCDEAGFNAEEAHNIVKECIDGVLGGEDYDHTSINQWTASIVEQSLAHLVKLGKAYKYIVTCAVVQRSAYGFHTANSCFWDTTSDGKRLYVDSNRIQLLARYLYCKMGEPNHELHRQCFCHCYCPVTD